MHETTRRSFCRFVFVVAALLPFAATIVFSLAAASPWYREWQRAAWETRLSENIGLEVRLASIDFVAPQQFQAKDIVCIHPETREEIAKVKQLDGLMTSAGWQVIFSEPVLNGLQMDHALTVFHDWFLCRPQKASHVVNARIRNGLTIHHGDSRTVIRKIDFSLHPSDSHSGFFCNFELEDQPFGEIKLVVDRNHQPVNPTTSWTLNSPKVALPCSIAWKSFPVLKNLGSKALFQGKTTYSVSGATSQCVVEGRFWDIDLSKSTMALGSPIRGFGVLDVVQLNIENGRILGLNSTFASERGQLQSQWIRLASEKLGWALDGSMSNSEWTDYERIQCAFQLNEKGTLIVGSVPMANRTTGLIANLSTGNLYTPQTPVPMQSFANWLRSARSGRDSVEFQDSDLTGILASTLPWPNSNPGKSLSPAAASLARKNSSRSTQ